MQTTSHVGENADVCPPGAMAFALPKSLAWQKSEVTDLLTRALLPLSDSRNARRFCAQFGKRFRHVNEVGWHYYDGRRWNAEIGEQMAIQHARLVADRIKDEVLAYERATPKQLEAAAKRAAEGGNDEDAIAVNERAEHYDQKLRRHATRSGNYNSVRGMLALAQVDLRARLDDFDRDPLALNVANGTLRFYQDREGAWHVRLDPHDPLDMITKLCPHDYKPTARAPTWLGHLERMLPDTEIRDYVQRILGYCMTGLQTEQAFFVFQGRGGDGKSTTVNDARRIMGEYALVSDIKTFLAQRGQNADSATPSVRRLVGDVRLVSASEPPRDALLNEERMKAATGGAPLTARGLHQGIIEFQVRWKLIIEANWLPEIAGTDDGIWRRAHLVPWRVQLKREEMDRTLEDRIVQNEAEGVLRWLVDGACAYLNQGLSPPPAAIEAVGAWRHNADPIGEWLAARTHAMADAITMHKELWLAGLLRALRKGGSGSNLCQLQTGPPVLFLRPHFREVFSLHSAMGEPPPRNCRRDFVRAH